MKKIFVLLTGFLIANFALALEPVTGTWNDVSDAQKRTAYSIEVQNNFVFVYIYSYAENNASADPTWYAGSGYLTQNADGTASGNFQIITVSNNQVPNAEGNVPSGMMNITFNDQETATINWEGFPATKQATSVIKKYWFLGTNTSAQSKRYAAVGLWQYALTNPNNTDYLSFTGTYYDARDHADLYSNIDDDVLIGKTSAGYPMAKALSDSGTDVSLVAFPNGDIYFYETGGGAEYSSGAAALVSTGKTPKISDFVFSSIGVRLASRDNNSGGVIIKSDDKDLLGNDKVYIELVKKLKDKLKTIKLNK